MALSPSHSVISDVGLEEIVFSCAICQATPSEVYATVESNKGFNGGSAQEEDGIVTKMWIAECSHVTCARHLQDGAPPFHPKDVQPKAPCPRCLRDKGDDALKSLYGIRGLRDGEYDDAIPSEWRTCPAIHLDSSIDGMSAVRFQYMSLAHYARQVRKHWRLAERNRLESDAACNVERKRCRVLEVEISDLKEKARNLERIEPQLKRWEERKAELTHYVRKVPEMMREIESLRTELHSLGIDVSERRYSFQPPKKTPSNSEAEREREHGRGQIEHVAVPLSGRKRKWDESNPRDRDHPNFQHMPLRRSSRETMPPPPLRTSPSQSGQQRLTYHDTYKDRRQPLSDPMLQTRMHSAFPPRNERTHIARSSAKDSNFPDDACLEPRQPGSFYEYTAHQPDRNHISTPTVIHSTHGNAFNSFHNGMNLAKAPLPYATVDSSPLHDSRTPASLPPSRSFQRSADIPAISPCFSSNQFERSPQPLQLPPIRDGQAQRDRYSHGNLTHGGTNDTIIERPMPQHYDQAANDPSHLRLPRLHDAFRVANPPATSHVPGARTLPSLSTMPQTPRNSQGFLRRPDLLSSSSSQTWGRRQTNEQVAAHAPQSSYHRFQTYRDLTVRDSLYPWRPSARPARADEQLLQVPGVKGARPLHSSNAFSRPGTGYGAVRGLFSSAGTRRRV